MRIETTGLDSSEVGMGPQPIRAGTPRKPGNRQMKPCRAVLPLPTVRREIEPEVRYPDGEVVMTVDHDRIAVNRRRRSSMDSSAAPSGAAPAQQAARDRAGARRRLFDKRVSSTPPNDLALALIRHS